MSVATTLPEPAAVLEANWSYLQDELARLRLLLGRHIQRQQADVAQSNGATQAYIYPGAQAGGPSGELAALTARCQAALQRGDLPLQRLALSFGLTAFEAEALRLALAVELDTSFEALFAQCQGSDGARLPTVALALRLFCDTAEAWVRGRAAFSAAGPLLRFRMIHLESGSPSLLSTCFHLDERVVSYLLGSTDLPAARAARSEFVQPVPEGQFLHGELAACLTALLERALGPGRSERLIVNLFGPVGAGKRSVAAAACSTLNVPVLAAKAGALLAEQALLLFLHEATLQQAAPYLDCADLVEESRAALAQACRDSGRLLFLGTPERANWYDPPTNTLFIPLEVPEPSVSQRRRLWHCHLGDALNGQADALAVRFSFTPGDIARVAGATSAAALLRDDYQLLPGDVWRAARDHPRHRLSELARRIEPRHTWDDIVLPDAARQQLREIGQQVAQQARVYEAWGFGRKLSRGCGVSALFSGPSGTGKTLAAEILAGALELDLYRIDLSCVVSKYIGETEKNLARLFDEAERSGAILFFDEADALFGKRSEVKDAHDRYANIEINYLLQRMEEYEGLAVLATNMRQALDEAFLRRLRFLVEFPFPDAALRAEIWRKAFPKETPQQDLDLGFLARQLKLPGGNIHNIALNAAFLAATDDIPVAMPHIMLAAKRELEKIGKVCLEADFGPYFELVR